MFQKMVTFDVILIWFYAHYPHFFSKTSNTCLVLGQILAYGLNQVSKGNHLALKHIDKIAIGITELVKKGNLKMLFTYFILSKVISK